MQNSCTLSDCFAGAHVCVCLCGWMKCAHGHVFLCVREWKPIWFGFFFFVWLVLACGLNEIVKSCSLVGAHFVFSSPMPFSVGSIRQNYNVGNVALNGPSISLLSKFNVWFTLHTLCYAPLIPFKFVDISLCPIDVYNRMYTNVPVINCVLQIELE